MIRFMTKSKPPILWFSALGCLGASISPTMATTKGLNQIPTPDLQPEKQLSISYQLVHPKIDNANQLQAEYGITNRFELAAVKGFNPSELRLGGEYSLIQKRPYLLSVGFLNYSTLSPHPQAFLEAGYYKSTKKMVDKYQLMAGAVRVNGRVQGMVGAQIKLNPCIWLSADYQGGAANSSTVGVTFVSKDGKWVFNPALYITNSAPHHTYGYAVVTYTFDFSAHTKQS